jgi:hypothetical protein
MDVLGEDLLLLSIDPRSGKIVTDRLGYGLAGSELVRLAAAGRISIDRDRIIVAGVGPTGDAELDAALASIAGSRRPPAPKHWIGQRRTGIHEAYLARLGRARAVAPGKASFLGQPRWQITDAERVRLDSHLYPGFGGHSQRKRLAQVARGQWTAAAVKAAANAAGVSAMAASDAAAQAAMNAAMNAATQAAMTAAMQASVAAAMPPADGTGAEAPHHH